MTAQNKITEYVGAFVAVAVVLLTAGTAVVLLTQPIPATNETIIGQLQGSLWTSLGMVVSYFFGSSVGTRLKDATINTQAENAGKAQDALAPLETDTILLKPGERATATATFAGTVIEPKP